MANQNDASDAEMSEDDLDKIIAEMSAQEEHGADSKKFTVEAEIAEGSLKQEMDNLVNSSSAPSPDPTPDPIQAPSPAPLSVVAPIAGAPVPETKMPSVGTENQVLSMELTGAINLKLCFTSPGKKIEVQCTEDYLLCRMADGTEFKIPTGLTAKKVA